MTRVFITTDYSETTNKGTLTRNDTCKL